MGDFNRDLKLVKIDNNHILATDTNNKIIATGITVAELNQVVQDSTKVFYIQSEEETNLTAVDNPELINKFQDILEHITFDENHNIIAFPIIYIYVNTINGYVPTNIYINPTTYSVYIEARYISSNVADTITDTNATYKEYHSGIEMKTDENFSEVIYTKYTTTLSYITKTYDILSTQSTLSGNNVTYTPQYDGQPTNKKYVDTQDSLLENRINALEVATNDIGERLDAINGEVIN